MKIDSQEIVEVVVDGKFIGIFRNGETAQVWLRQNPCKTASHIVPLGFNAPSFLDWEAS